MQLGPAFGIVLRTIVDYDQSGETFRKRERIFDAVVPPMRLRRVKPGIQSGLISLIVNRQAIALAGGVDERFKHIEDTEWIFRIAFRGSTVFSLAEPFLMVHNHRNEDRSTCPSRFGKRCEKLRTFPDFNQVMSAADPGSRTSSNR